MATAWLKLLWAPRGVKVTPIERSPMSLGESLELEDGGRSMGTEGELRVTRANREADPDAPVKKLHCRIHFRDGQWRIFHYGNSFTTFINGNRRLEWVLAHNDVVELEQGPVFRFQLQQEGSGDPALAEQLAEQPSSPERLAVWADHLLERGSSLGERIQAALRNEPSPPEDARRWLGPLARLEQQARLDLKWRFGMLESAALRDLAPFGAEPLAMIPLLLQLDVARTLESLWLDCAGVASNASSFVTAVEHAKHMPSLRRISFGDCDPHAVWAADVEHEYWNRLKAVAPRLERAPLFQRFVGARLKVLTPFPGSPTAPGTEIQIESRTELIDVPAFAAELGGMVRSFDYWRFKREHSRFRLDPSLGAPTLVNDKPALQAALRDGDLLQLGRGLFRFELVR
ncbi:MAG: FHA domain-containing protein [Myxococcaceae bacterium]